MLFFIPAFLVVCKMFGLLSFSWPITLLMGGCGAAFSLFFMIHVSRSLTDKNEKDATVLLDDIFWAYQIMFFVVIGYFATTKYLAIGIYMVMPVVISMLPVGKRRDLFIFGGLGAAVLVLLSIHHDYTLTEFLFQAEILMFAEIAQYLREKLYSQKVVDESKIVETTAMAETDSMTKLLNRRGLERRIAATWPMCARQNTSVAIIMMDIDYFKKYNDAFGHPKGDECLKKVSTEIAHCVRRQTDYAARVGGEEFLVFLYGAGPQDALNWAKTLKDRIEGLLIPHATNNFLPFVTVSMGIATKNVERGDAFWELQNEADKQLYGAKEYGRACICMKDQCYAKVQSQSQLNKTIIKEKGFRVL